MRIPTQIYNYIEFELSTYAENKDTLKEEMERILEESYCFDGQPRPTTISSPTENKAIARLSSPVIITLGKNINAIENTLKPLSDIHNKIFEEYYVKGKRNRVELSMALNISIETFKRYRKEIIYGVGARLGLINFKLF